MITAVTMHNIIIISVRAAGHIYIYTKRGTACSEAACIKNNGMNYTIVSVSYQPMKLILRK